MPPEIDQSATHAAEAVARRSYGKLVAFLAARTRDVAGAEDALSEAFAAALVDWPASGIPASPEAWLMAVARRKLIDAGRRQRCAVRKPPGFCHEEVSANQSDQPDNSKQSEAHLQDLQGSWFVRCHSSLKKSGSVFGPEVYHSNV